MRAFTTLERLQRVGKNAGGAAARGILVQGAVRDATGAVAGRRLCSAVQRSRLCSTKSRAARLAGVCRGPGGDGGVRSRAWREGSAAVLRQSGQCGQRGGGQCGRDRDRCHRGQAGGGPANLIGRWGQEGRASGGWATVGRREQREQAAGEHRRCRDWTFVVGSAWKEDGKRRGERWDGEGEGGGLLGRGAAWQCGGGGMFVCVRGHAWRARVRGARMPTVQQQRDRCAGGRGRKHE